MKTRYETNKTTDIKAIRLATGNTRSTCQDYNLGQSDRHFKSQNLISSVKVRVLCQGGGVRGGTRMRSADITSS